MNLKSIIIFLVISINFSCSDQNKTYIVSTQEEFTEAANDLFKYLSKTYPLNYFEIVKELKPGSRNIVLEKSNDNELENDEAFKISGNSNQLSIQGKTSRAVMHGVYSFLKYIGWNFYLSFEVPPSTPQKLDFSEIQIENKPLTKRRILFNWHNFISGCTAWDFNQWRDWIDNGSKIGFNTIMVHAYGNNPMNSFTFNGKEKELGYLTTTQKGRDWGAQHVNDIRLLEGGEIFNNYEFGSSAAKVPEAERSKAATKLMQSVFKHAAKEMMNVCFAIDIDTWMANPQNIINTLPKEALIEIKGYQTVNPEHPEGKKYYKAQLEKLLSDYPEINILAAWIRKPRKDPKLGTIWLFHESSTLPVKWRKEYFEILKKHPEVKDERPYPGLFALSKIIKVYREILNEIKPGVELILGSWNTEFTEYADLFMPKYCGFIPLDYSQILNQPDIVERLKKVGKNRDLYPVVWGHHDDHRYIGRPYIPYPMFMTY